MEPKEAEAIVLEFLNSISLSLKDDIKKVINLQGGKKGAVYLQGPASCGKSIIVKLMCAYYDFKDIGIIPHTSDTDKFMFQDCIDKNLLVAEEIALTDIGADCMKLVLEGHFLASGELKGSGRVLIEKTPAILTANRNLVSCCGWQWLPLSERMYIHLLSRRVPENHPINFVHTADRKLLKRIARSLFIDRSDDKSSRIKRIRSQQPELPILPDAPE